MDIFKFAERIMTMDEEAWARHSNPWSVYSRFSCLPLISLACWLRGSLGWLFLLPLAASLVWTWYNPRAFPPPGSTDNWASKGTFGERIFLRRNELDIPKHHLTTVRLLSIAFALGLLPLIYGFVTLNGWAIVTGNVLVIIPKLWFVDRMVWVYEDMKGLDEEFSGWVK